MIRFMFRAVRFTVRLAFILIAGLAVTAVAIRALDATHLFADDSRIVVSNLDGAVLDADAQPMVDDPATDVLDDVYRQAAALPKIKRRGFLLQRACDPSLTPEAARKIRTVMALVD